MNYEGKQINTEKKHELKKLVPSISDISRFDEILREIEKKCFYAGYNQCKENVENSF